MPARGYAQDRGGILGNLVFQCWLMFQSGISRTLTTVVYTVKKGAFWSGEAESLHPVSFIILQRARADAWSFSDLLFRLFFFLHSQAVIVYLIISLWYSEESDTSSFGVTWCHRQKHHKSHEVNLRSKWFAERMRLSPRAFFLGPELFSGFERGRGRGEGENCFFVLFCFVFPQTS